MKIPIDADSRTPVYQQIADGVRDQIAIGALAPGDALPTRRALALALGIDPNTVGRAYGALQCDGLVESRSRSGTRVRSGDTRGDAARQARLQLLTARMIGDGLSHGYSLAELEAAFIEQSERWQEQRRAGAAAGRHLPEQVLGIGSQDACLDVLLAELRAAHPEMSIQFSSVGSLAGLMALARGEVHFAAAHLYDAESDEYNLPYVRRLMPQLPCALITLSFRAQGLLIARGNPRKIQGLRDLARPRIRFINRQPGSGTRTLLDRLLRTARIAPRRITGYGDEVATHTAVAAAIASRHADAGLGIEAVARAFELDFVPLVRERYEVILHKASPLVGAILSVIRRPDFPGIVNALGGYDISKIGHVRHA